MGSGKLSADFYLFARPTAAAHSPSNSAKADPSHGANLIAVRVVNCFLDGHIPCFHAQLFDKSPFKAVFFTTAGMESLFAPQSNR